MDLRKIWKEKSKIIEGWLYLKLPFLEKKKAREFRQRIVGERHQICASCSLYDTHGIGCEIPGTAPCCNLGMGGCGCSLNAKQHSLSSSCPKGKWPAIFTDKQQYYFDKNLEE